MPIRFQWLDATKLQVVAESLIPERLSGLGLSEVARLPIDVGNRVAEVGDVFKVVSADNAHASDDLVVFEGDLRNVRGLGSGMSRGNLRIEGRGGDGLGAGMSGGRIEVVGDVGRDAGVEMTGGFLTIQGNAGHSLGGVREGARLGMRNGVIIVKGNAGDDVGRRMRRGVIVVEGSAGDGLGGRLVAGSILVFGTVGRATGMSMKRGTIALFQSSAATLLPSFVNTGRFRFPFLTLYFKQLEAWGVRVEPSMFSATLSRYNGDLTEGGRGEILTRA